MLFCRGRRGQSPVRLCSGGWLGISHFFVALAAVLTVVEASPFRGLRRALLPCLLCPPVRAVPDLVEPPDLGLGCGSSSPGAGDLLPAAPSSAGLGARRPSRLPGHRCPGGCISLWRSVSSSSRAWCSLSASCLLLCERPTSSWWRPIKNSAQGRGGKVRANPPLQPADQHVGQAH